MSKHFGNNQRSRYFGTYPQIPNILAHTLKVQNILAPLIKFHQNILAPTLKFHQNILAPTLKFQIFWHLHSNFKYFGTYPQIPGPALICSRKPPDKHRKEWKSFWNNNSLWVGFNTAWWYFPPSPSFNMMTHPMDNLAVDILPGCIFHNCNFDICHETTDKYKNQKMKIRVSWDGQSTSSQLTSSLAIDILTSQLTSSLAGWKKSERNPLTLSKLMFPQTTTNWRWLGAWQDFIKII